MSTKTTLQPIPYLSFNGNCSDAMRFYENVLGGSIKVMMSGGQSPMAAQIPKEFADRIMNAQLELPGGSLLYAGDCPSHIPYEGVKGVTIALNYNTVDEAEAIFNKLAEGPGDHAVQSDLLGQEVWNARRQIRSPLDYQRRTHACLSTIKPRETRPPQMPECNTTSFPRRRE